MVLALARHAYFKKGLVVLLVVTAGLVSGYLATSAAAIRPLMALAAMMGVVTLADRQPRSLILLLFAVLPFLGLARRLLIPIAGWSGMDPLLMLTPAAAVCLLGFWVVRRPDPALSTPLAKAITLMILISAVQIANPLQGGPMVGLGGALVLIPPLWWFYVGNRLADDRLVQTLLNTMKVIGVVVALYGLYQTFYGFLPVEETWFELAGYISLYVGADVIRAMSTFAASTEYAGYVALAAIICIVQAVTTRRLRYLLPLAIFVPAIFLVSSRGPLVGLAVVMISVYASRAETQAGVLKRLFFAVVFTLVFGSALLKGLAAISFGSPALQTLADHQINGLLHPTDETHSTANLHGNMVIEGIKRGFRNPFGRGVGIITPAADKFGPGAYSYEFDISNVFFSLGLVGGLTYTWIVLTVLRTSWWLYRLTKKQVLLAVSGMLVYLVSSWWAWGHYVLTPMVWLLVGYINQSALSYRTSQATAPEGGADPGAPPQAQHT